MTSERATCTATRWLSIVGIGEDGADGLSPVAQRLIASAELPGQRGFAFGPGTAPRLFAGLLAGLGFLVSAMGAMTEGPAIERYKLRGPLLVILSILLFAVMIRPFGLIIATFCAFMFSILGTKEMRWLESLIAGVGMTAFCWLLASTLADCSARCNATSAWATEPGSIAWKSTGPAACASRSMRRRSTGCMRSSSRRNTSTILRPRARAA